MWLRSALFVPVTPRKHAHAGMYVAALRALRVPRRARYAVVARRAHGQLLSAGAADALDTYVVRHLGTLMAFSAMLPAVFAAGTPGAAGEHHP